MPLQGLQVGREEMGTEPGACPQTCQVFKHLRTVSADIGQETCVDKDPLKLVGFACAPSGFADTVSTCAARCPVSVNTK